MLRYSLSLTLTLLAPGWLMAEPPAAAPTPPQAVEVQEAPAPAPCFRERLRRWFHRNEAPDKATVPPAKAQYGTPLPTGIACHSDRPGLPTVNLSGGRGW
jgi:hypothetical protein